MKNPISTRRARMLRSASGLSCMLALASIACTSEEEGSLVRSAQQEANQELSEFTCGYEIETGTYTTWNGGYQAWVEVSNIQGEVGTDFAVFLDVGDSEIVDLYQANYEEVEGGYLVHAPDWLVWQTIPEGASFRFAFVGSGEFEDVTPYVIGVNEESCDTVAPEIELSVESTLVTASGAFELQAEASDGVAVRKVVFTLDGEVIGEDTEAPYTLEFELTDAENGRREFGAKAVDPSLNEASASESVLVAIGNRFLGSAPSSENDYQSMLGYFNQLTPENAGKWGVVESTRDVYDWAPLDEAFAFAQEHGMRFKHHTVIWGQQSPNWLNALPPEEQLEEIEEWMSLLAARYGDVDWIDVVNEPINAPPAFMDALGGPGETGYDWVIKAFELARLYFPNSELLLNEYNVLILEPFTQSYLEVVTLLQERGLIDGIGLQAHFLERAEIDEVSSNLSLLSATGLPIYISEVDVNFADDARHANTVQDLFTTFWNNPSVLGVTNWGHLQGDVWQENAYLIRTDDTLRPGFEWMLCYYAGGTDCTVPDYVPPGWQGTQSGLTLEAELYDEAEGVIALGDVVAYTDVGDWLSYTGVEFQETWDTFSVTYAKGNEETGSISVILDSIENDPLFTIELPPTAGWGSFDTIEVPWPALSTTHDVYITFNDVYGLGNIDRFRFSAPSDVVNIVDNGDFEQGISPWFSWAGGALATTEPQNVHTGMQAMELPSPAQAAIDIFPKVTVGEPYQVSAWVKVSGDVPNRVNMSLVRNCEDGSGDQYPWITDVTDVSNTEFVQITGEFTIDPSCDLSKLLFYFQGNDGYTIYVDDVIIAGAAPTNLLANGDFESGVAPWFGWGTGDRVVTDPVDGYDGQSLWIQNRGDATAATDILSAVEVGGNYEVSAWVKVGGDAPALVNFSLVRNCGSGDEYPWVMNETAVPHDGWVQMQGGFSIDPMCDLQNLLFYIQGDPGYDIFADNIVISAAP